MHECVSSRLAAGGVEAAAAAGAAPPTPTVPQLATAALVNLAGWCSYFSRLLLASEASYFVVVVVCSIVVVLWLAVAASPTVPQLATAALVNLAGRCSCLDPSFCDFGHVFVSC